MKNIREFVIKHYAFFTLIFLIVTSTTTYCYISQKKEVEEVEIEYSKEREKVAVLQEELSDKDNTIANLNDRIYELEDDIVSMEIQYAEEIQELKDTIQAREDEMDLLCVTRYQEALAAIPEDYPDDIKEYILDGGEVESIGDFKCTAYCCEKRKHICGTGTGITASGEPVQAYHSVAINKDNLGWLPFGTKIYIEDVGVRYVEDTGPAVRSNQFDCAVEIHDEALRWSGAGTHRAWILK